jgi:hypothetical protein
MIFISAPYSHPDKKVVEHRVKIVCEYSARLLQQRFSCVSPILVGTGILQYASLPTDYAFWKDLSLDLLSLCSHVRVLMLDGWESSIGVTDEIRYAELNEKHIMYVNEQYLESLLLKP